MLSLMILLTAALRAASENEVTVQSPTSDIVLVTAVSGVVAIIVALIGRGDRERTRRIDRNTQPTGNGWTRYLDGRLDAMEGRLSAGILKNQSGITDLQVRTAHLEEKLRDHVKKKKKPNDDEVKP